MSAGPLRRAARWCGRVPLEAPAVLGRSQAHPGSGDPQAHRSLRDHGGPRRRAPLGIVEWGELPSAGDTSYAGVAPMGRVRFLVSWYSSSVPADPGWLTGLLSPS